MKCPKCAYMGFEESDRCRHCGYDFSLIAPATEAASPSPLRVVEPSRQPSYREPSRAVAEAELSRADSAPLVDLPLAAPASTPLPMSLAGGAAAAPAVAPSLPPSLFADPQPPPARTPLAVRRTAERPRSRATPHVVRRPRPVLLEPAGADDTAPAAAPAEAVVAAPPVARLLSVAVDVALLAGIDAAVVYLTAQIASVPMGQVMTLPLVPLAAFIVGLNLSYLAVFTANGGQTLGKMAAGLRVESTDGTLTFGGAVVRVVAAIVGALVVGAGFLPALFRADRRAVHDQIAHTRVVKVSA
jgi:uncharacterized RDD family membrane protein YckC